MNLDAIAGHARVRAFLKNALRDGSVSHAYLFVGPTGVGKTATALAFAADLLEAAAVAPGSAVHPDLWVEDSATETIGVDLLRRDRGARSGPDPEAEAGVPAQPLQAFLSLKGMYSDRRVAVVARAQRLTDPAASALLKTIEEPPEGAVLVLCAEAAELLPPTIRSRCQELEFGRLADPDVTAFLTAQGEAATPELLRLARGCPGVALRLARDPDEQSRRAGWTGALAAVLDGSWIEIVGLGARFGTGDAARNRGLAREALDAWEWWLRDVAAARVEGTAAGDAAADGIDIADLLRLWESAREAADRVENNVNPRLAIEVFLADVQALRRDGAVPAPFAAGVGGGLGRRATSRRLG
ncbi:MAG: polymerase subunit delta [Chloroflexota bacterium]|jgi:DNA polymerase-3 subunit delta'|nr:polymerase subunit delta [Chloroflexota bacterium]